MITPGLPRWVAGLLGDPTTGVNEIAPLVPRDVADPVPPAIAVYNAFDASWVARKHSSDEATVDEWPILVRPAEEMQMAGAVSENVSLDDSATVIIELQGVTIDADNAKALATAYTIMRAVRYVLHQAFLALGNEPLMIDGQMITMPAQLQAFTLDGKAGSGQIDISLALPFTLTDTWALGVLETP